MLSTELATTLSFVFQDVQILNYRFVFSGWVLIHPLVLSVKTARDIYVYGRQTAPEESAMMEIIDDGSMRHPASELSNMEPLPFLSTCQDSICKLWLSRAETVFTSNCIKRVEVYASSSPSSSLSFSRAGFFCLIWSNISRLV